ncbi:hypothetical protein M514_10364 [Trichuris suis]|uniref:Uncharacterized protein n=1 Tax=Trichuris suis TaxID=68888 RepID=A0A085LUT8_9BILA|nr:hypothetical protein M513_10364 [Trichuris suis]KFD67915.1 hypothetical protein M514_10364 [Trichuris suis]
MALGMRPKDSRRLNMSLYAMPVYDGPFLVLARSKKAVTILQRGRPVFISLDRVKPTFYTPPSTSKGATSVTFRSDVDIVR